MSKSRRPALSVLAAVLATLLVGSLVVRQLKWQDLWALRAQSDLRLLALGFAVYLLATWLRAVRYRALTDNLIPTRQLLRTVIVQNLLNTFLPLRAGEASYLYMVHRSGAVKPGDNVGSLLGARVLDLLAALSIPAATLPLSRASAIQGIPLGWLAALPLAGVLALGIAISKAEPLANWLAGRAVTGRAWLNRGLRLASDVLRSLGKLRNGSLLGRVTLLSLLCWALMYLSGYFALRGVGLHLPFFDCVFAYGFPLVASMMPFYMLGGFGVYEGSIGVGLNLVGIALGPAMAAGLALHVAELLFVLLPAPLTLVPQLWPRAGEA